MTLEEKLNPYKKKLTIESVIVSSAVGLFLGSLLTLVLALFFRFVVDLVNPATVIVSILLGVALGVTIGILSFHKMFKKGMQDVAKRIDSLGLQDRVTTMVEFKDDKSFVAKMQRDDATEHLSRLEVKAIKIRIPIRILSACLAFLVATTLIFSVNVGADPVDEIIEEIEKIEEEVKEEIEDILEDSQISDSKKEELDKIIQEGMEEISKAETPEDKKEEVDELIKDIEDFVEKEQ